MSAQTIKRQAARIGRLMAGGTPRHVCILDNGGTEHATLTLYTAVHSGRYKGRARGFAGYEDLRCLSVPFAGFWAALVFSGIAE